MGTEAWASAPGGTEKEVGYEEALEADFGSGMRVWGDTAVVTAELFGKGTENGKAFEWTLGFSDTYVRTPTGWRYVLGQASLPLPKRH